MERRRALMSVKAEKEHGKNLLNIHRTEGIPDPTTLSASTRVMSTARYYVGLTYNNYYNPSKVTAYSIVDDSVLVSGTATAYGICFPVEVSENTQYTLSCVNIEANTILEVGFFTAEWEFISFSNITITPDHKYRTYTTPENCKYLIVDVAPFGAAENRSASGIQLELGTEATEYEPYI